MVLHLYSVSSFPHCARFFRNLLRALFRLCSWRYPSLMLPPDLVSFGIYVNVAAFQSKWRHAVFLFNTKPNHKRSFLNLLLCNILHWLDLKSTVKTRCIWLLCMCGLHAVLWILENCRLKSRSVSFKGLLLQIHMIWSCISAILCLTITPMLSDLLTEKGQLPPALPPF